MTSSGGWSAQAPAPGAAASGTAAPGAATPAPLSGATPSGALGATAVATPPSGAAHTPVATSSAPSRLGSSDVPTALTRWQAVLTLAVVVWALLSVVLLANSFQKTQQGAANTQQLTRIHAITSSLFQADAIATNAFLVGGLEPAEQRMAYDAALDEVSRLIVDAAEAQPADKAALAVLNDQVLAYAEQMQQARANNRQGLPVGAQYLREASASLRSDTVPVLDALLDANEQRANSSLTGHHWYLVALPGLALLALFGWFNQELAALFRRRINLGLAAAGAIVGVVTIAATLVVWSLASGAAELREGSFAEAAAVAAARTAANDAKSNESLRLISRGSGAQYEDAWGEADGIVTANIAGHPALVTLWSAYQDGHAEIIATEESGDWEEAVSLAVSTEDGSTTASFIAFDDEASAVVGLASKAVSTSLQSGTWTAVVMAVVTALAAGAALVGVSWGLTARRKEFA